MAVVAHVFKFTENHWIVHLKQEYVSISHLLQIAVKQRLAELKKQGSLYSDMMVEFCGYENGIWYMIPFILTVWFLEVNLSMIYFTPL